MLTWKVTFYKPEPDLFLSSCHWKTDGCSLLIRRAKMASFSRILPLFLVALNLLVETATATATLSRKRTSWFNACIHELQRCLRP